MAQKGYNAKLGVDIDLIKGNWIKLITWTITDGNDLPYDFTGFTAMEIEVWNRKPRTKGRNTVLTWAEPAEITVTGNVISLDVAFPEGLLDFGSYNYELTWAVGGRTDLFIAEGTFKVI